MKEFVDYYEVLELNEKASLEEINKAFRKKVMKIRPDLNTDDNTRRNFEILQDAKRTLTDSLDRKLYDLKHSMNYFNEFANFAKSEMKKNVQNYENYLVREMNEHY